MMKILVSFLALTGAAAFAPAVRPLPKTTVLMVVKEKNVQHDWIKEITDWFASVTSPTQKKVEKQDDWVVKELNEMGESEQEVGVWTAVEKEEGLWPLSGFPWALKKEPVKHGYNRKEKEVWPISGFPSASKKGQSLQVEQDADKIVEDMLVSGLPLIAKEEQLSFQFDPKYEVTTAKVAKVDEPEVSEKDRWIARDMYKAGKGETETKDWVADDMLKAGKLGSLQHSTWVEEDMKDAGQAGVSHTPSLKLEKKKTREDRIAEDLERVGRSLDQNWVAKDMVETGRRQEQKNEGPWTEKLRNALTKEREHAYDDIYDDMEQAGKIGSHSKDFVADDMIRLGKAEEVAEKLRHIEDDYSYKRTKMEKKALDIDEIRKDMETAGHAEEQAWIAHDLETTGMNQTMEGHIFPAPKEELAEFLSEARVRSSVAKDMELTGKDIGTSTRKQQLSGKKLEQMIAEDMELVGKARDTSIEYDMERTAHTSTHLGQVFQGEPHKQSETKAFMSTRKPKLAPVEEDEDAEEEDHVAKLESGQDKRKHNFKRVVRRATKKIVMPWKHWEDL